MMFSLVTLSEQVVVRLPPTQDPDAKVFAVSVTLIELGQSYGALSYEDLRSLGDGMWDLPGEPAGWTTPKARRIVFDIPNPNLESAAPVSDPVPTT